MSESTRSLERVMPDIVDDMDGSIVSAVAADTARTVHEVALVESMVAALRPASVRATVPSDWVDFGGKLHLQGTGVDRIAPHWGLVFGAFKMERENHDDGTFSYICAGPVGCRKTGVFFQMLEGMRWSGDGFFTEPIDPSDVRKAAFENWKSRAGMMLTGLRGLTQADVAKLGLTGVQTIEFKKGAKGGKAQAMNTEGVALVPFGAKYKGHPVTELDAPAMKWYIEAAEKAIVDPEKAQYRAKNKAWLDSLLAEQERRFQATSGPEEGAP